MKIIKVLRFFGSFIRSTSQITIGFIIIMILLTMGFIISLFGPSNPRAWNYAPRDSPPSSLHLFGTTTLGQDVFWLITHAIRNSIILGVTGSIVGLAAGAILGIIAGLKGGLLEKILLLFGDVFIVIPMLPIIVLISSLVRASLNMFTLGLFYACLTWGFPVRNVRSIILGLREKGFTYTAYFSNMSMLRIIFNQYLPYVIPWMLASFIGRILGAIGMEATLAVFGLISLTETTIGTMIYDALQYKSLMRGLWWWFSAPVFILIILFVSLNLISTGIAEHLDPRNRIRRLAKG